ncbi:autotransporter outer membrane beta-barrel domain-containing protein [Providencia alcalifaciens]
MTNYRASIFTIGLLTASINSAFSNVQNFNDGGVHNLVGFIGDNKGTPYTATISASNSSTVNIGEQSNISALSPYSFGVVSSDSATINITNSKVNSVSNYSFSVAAKQSGIVNISGSEITSESGGNKLPSSGSVLSSGNGAVVNIENSKIIASSNGSTTDDNGLHIINSAGVISEGNGEVNITNSSINTSGDVSSGIFAQANGNVFGSGIDVTTSGKKSSAIEVTGESTAIINNNSVIKTTGDDSHGINLSGGKVTLSESSVTTEGQSNTVNAQGSNSSLSIEKSELSTFGDSAHAIYIGNKANASLNKIEVSTSGLSSYGVLATDKDTKVSITDSSITTSGDINSAQNYSSNAVVSQFGSAITLNGTNKIKTKGNKAAGLLSQVSGEGLDTSIITTGHTDISTEGNNAFGLVSCSLQGGGRECLSILEEGNDGSSPSSKSLIEGTGITVNTIGEASYAAYANGKDASINIKQASLSTTGANAHGIAIRQGSVTGDGLNVKVTGIGANGAALYNGGTLNLSNSNLVSESANGVLITGNGTDSAVVSLDKSTVDGASSAIAINNGSANINLTDSYLMSSKSNVLFDNKGGEITVNAQNSTLDGVSVLGDHSKTDVSLVNSVWEQSSGSVMTNLIMSNSDLYFRKNNDQTLPSSNNTVHVKGNYYGDNATIHFVTRLEDDNSETNKLVIDGDTSGTSLVSVSNAGGMGGQTVNGIKLISVAGESNGVFKQQSRIVAGAHDYLLTKKDKDWYLVSHLTNPTQASKPLVRPEAGSYLANNIAANTMFNLSLYDRIGSAYHADFNGENNHSLWLRQVGEHSSFNDTSDSTKTRANSFTTQLGGDIYKGSSNGNDAITFGVFGGYGYSSSKTKNHLTGYSAKGHVDGYSIGLYGTWFENPQQEKGLYVDSWLQYAWFNNSVDGQELSTEKYKSKGATVSLEIGSINKVKEFVADDGSRTSLTVKPHSQLIYMGVKPDAFVESNGTVVKSNISENLQTKLGVRLSLNKKFIDVNKEIKDITPFVEANWIHNTKGNSVSMNGYNIDEGGVKNLAQFKIGVDGKINNNLSIWANTSVQAGAHDNTSIQGMVGLSYKL